MTKLVATDLDGTLLNSQGKLTKNTIDVFHRMKEQNINIVIASGRTSDEISRMIQPLDLEHYPHGYIISYNGVLTTKTCPFEIIEETFLEPDLANTIIDYLVDLNFKVHVFTPGKIYVSHDIEFYLKNETERQKISIRVDYRKQKINEPVYKILVYDEMEKLNLLKDTIPPAILEKALVFKSHSQLLEFVSIGGSKGDALTKLMERLSVSTSDSFAFGDEENDISMLKAVGTAVAVGNAKPLVKQSAHIVTLSNDYDGVAEILNHYVLEKKG